MAMRDYAYPLNWPRLSKFMRVLAGRCEQCSAPGGQWIRRHKGNPAMWELCSEHDRETWQWSEPVKVVLSVHHIGVQKRDGRPGSPHDKADCRPENLIVLCARCHLLADLELHMTNARRTRSKKARIAAIQQGQQELW